MTHPKSPLPETTRPQSCQRRSIPRNSSRSRPFASSPLASNTPSAWPNRYLNHPPACGTRSVHSPATSGAQRAYVTRTNSSQSARVRHPSLSPPHNRLRQRLMAFRELFQAFVDGHFEPILPRPNRAIQSAAIAPYPRASGSRRNSSTVNRIFRHQFGYCQVLPGRFCWPGSRVRSSWLRARSCAGVCARNPITACCSSPVSSG